MKYENKEHDIVERTLKILKGYGKSAIVEDEIYEVTLMINCLLGLIIVPKESGLKTYLCNDRIEVRNDWGISRVQVPDSHIKTVRDLVIKMRHSAAHFGIEFEYLDTKISKIIFNNTENKKTIVISFEPDQLHGFLVKLANDLLSNYRKQTK